MGAVIFSIVNYEQFITNGNIFILEDVFLFNVQLT